MKSLTIVMLAGLQAAVAVDVVATDAALRARAVRESAVPVRPGVPGAQPFWNEKAVQFLYAPAFDFKEVPGAAKYRFVITPEKGKQLSFETGKPFASLAPVWTKLNAGEAQLDVTALDAQGGAVGQPQTRAFHRAAVIAREYPAPVMSWRESARTALDALVHSPGLRCWFTTGEPDEETHLYRYPSKIVGATASVLATYAAQTPPPADAVEALLASRRAADYVLALSEPPDSPWAFHPPTYHPTRYREWLKGHMQSGRYMTLCGAETGQYYLDVFAATKDVKYRAAAVHIAETYAKRQLPEGSWLQFVTARDGKPVTDNVLVPTLVVGFLDRLAQVTGETRFDAMRAQAVAWIEKNPVKTWNWQGQFEDVKPLPPYQNLTKHDACDFAIHLFQMAAQSAERKALALDLLRFAEDQFVIWDKPPMVSPKDQNADGKAGVKARTWLLPCVLEQYRCYAPVCASSAKLIRTYLAAYGATRDPLHLEKAKALAGTLTRAQSHAKAPGRYQTWLMQNPGPMWFNCELAAIRAMEELAKVEQANGAGK
jgi:maltose/maltodextrin transport system substrate-binding protein